MFLALAGKFLKEFVGHQGVQQACFNGSLKDIIVGVYIFCLFIQALSHVQLFVTLWTIANQTPLSMGLPFPSPGDLPNPEIKPPSPGSLALHVDSLPTDPLGKPPKLLV